MAPLDLEALQRALPTPNDFYGREVGQEIWVDLEPGKTRVISLSAVGEPDEDGCRTVYFALNGHNRSVLVRDRSRAAKVEARRQADRGNPNHVAASMPGTVIALHVKPGARVEAGAPLVTLEAMKLERAQSAQCTAARSWTEGWSSAFPS
ncbi:biotin/lipoyl-containing protein [Pyxidicoccus caerfyrddinensis]|uniref:biotin/lipoyl-containing protein n=1 Tax=Pyxidicoccus caerfyrddinensis TaxID=2709663 RepID=UPI001F085CE4|nr:biotin/lipoyl-containing protein [Pyxidicoccus caerfyrddinensis]